MGDIEVDGKSLGQLAFEAYRSHDEPVTFDDKPIPEWDELHGNRARVQAKWEAAAAAVAAVVRASDRADRAFDKTYGGPDYRPQKSHAQPLDLTGSRTIEDLPAAPVTGLAQVDEARAARARRVGVEADDETGDDAA